MPAEFVALDIEGRREVHDSDQAAMRLLLAFTVAAAETLDFTENRRRDTIEMWKKLYSMGGHAVAGINIYRSLGDAWLRG
jgi:hypothetical protein